MDNVEEVTQPVVTAEDGIDELKRKLQEAETARASAEAGRAHAENVAASAQAQARQAGATVDDTNLALVKSAIDNTRRERDQLKAQYTTAMEASDFAGAADIQQSMADAAARLLQLESGKDAMEQRTKQPVQPVTAHPGNRVEQLASQLTPRSAAWVRAHPQYANDDRLYQKMLAAHNLVTADGVQADTDEYFKGVEGVLGLTETNTTEQPLSQAAAPTQQRNQPSAAPAGRGGAANKGNVVRLSEDERSIARMSGLSDEEYAKNRQELKAAGRLN